jgi:hypothetical protein
LLKVVVVVPEDVVPPEVVPEDVVPDEVVPEEVVPEDVVPDEVVPPVVEVPLEVVLVDEVEVPELVEPVLELTRGLNGSLGEKTLKLSMGPLWCLTGGLLLGEGRGLGDVVVADGNPVVSVPLPEDLKKKNQTRINSRSIPPTSMAICGGLIFRLVDTGSDISSPMDYSSGRVSWPASSSWLWRLSS